MLRCGMGGFFRILAFVKPPGVAQPVLLSAVSDELPHASRPRARKRRGLESTLRLGQVNKILRHALLAEHPTDHPAITAGTAQSSFDDGAPARCLEEIQEGQHF